jgi:hypothetical protein
VAHVHDGGTGEVVGVEGALPVGVRRRVVRAAADALEASVGLPVGVGPQHAERGLLREPVGRVARLRRRRDGVTEEVQVSGIGERCGARHARDEQDQHEREHGKTMHPATSLGIT